MSDGLTREHFLMAEREVRLAHRHGDRLRRRGDRYRHIAEKLRKDLYAAIGELSRLQQDKEYEVS